MGRRVGVKKRSVFKIYNYEVKGISTWFDTSFVWMTPGHIVRMVDVMIYHLYGRHHDTSFVWSTPRNNLRMVNARIHYMVDTMTHLYGQHHDSSFAWSTSHALQGLAHVWDKIY